MRVLVTGMNGTVAPQLARALLAAGHEAVRWSRDEAPPGDLAAARALVRRVQPDVAAHLATGPVEWAEHAARVCAEQGVRFLFTSSVSVFGGGQHGPFDPSVVPEPDDDYGRYKLEGERRVLAAHAGAQVVRLGWQLGVAPDGGNHMVEQFDRAFRHTGVVRASVHAIPACSFLPDTAIGLLNLLQAGSAGLHQFDGNPGFTLHEIATRLNARFDLGWRIEACEAPAYDHRMRDSRAGVAAITHRLHPVTGAQGPTARVLR